MISFFRKIRQNLLNEGKTARYFKYAIGEILLVVIGILIALQINNWNEKRKLDDSRQEYYTQLIDDLKKDKTLLIEKISKSDSLKSEYSAYIEIFNKESLTVTEMVSSLLKLNHRASHINFSSSTFESLEKSGDIKIIPKELRNKLLDLNRKQKSLEETIKSNGINQIVFVRDYIRDIGSRDLLNRLMKHPEIEDFLKNEINRPKSILSLESNMYWKILTDKSKKFIEILSDIDILLDKIESEINSHD